MGGPDLRKRRAEQVVPASVAHLWRSGEIWVIPAEISTNARGSVRIPLFGAGDSADSTVKEPDPRLVGSGRGTSLAQWQVQDSNLRRYTPTDLQSAPIGRSGNLPGMSSDPVWPVDNEAKQ
jgi:hypothetical protein